VANLSLIGINIGVILTCARGILTANKRPIREIKDSRMSPELPSWQKCRTYFIKHRQRNPQNVGWIQRRKHATKKK
jgi:hypothetical protein